MPNLHLPWFELLPAANPLDAAAQTAVATWYIFMATVAAAFATFMAVVVALVTAGGETRRRNREIRARDANALRGVLEAREFMRAVCDKDNEVDTEHIRETWTTLGRLSVYREVLKHYLSQELGAPTLPVVLADTLQRNYEVRDSIEVYKSLPQTGEDLSDAETDHRMVKLEMAASTLKSARDRMKVTEPQVEALKSSLVKE